jgi:lysophospholipase L1-like esterase
MARGLGLPYTSYATDGARAADVVGGQIPAWRARERNADARYDVGCLYVGVNDVRALDWDPAAFETDFGEALSALAGRCDRTLTLTIPLDLGRPRAGAKVPDANAIVERAAGEVGALVVDLRDFGARNLVMVDHVHPTAFGQIAIAERALDVLAVDGLEPRVRPSALISYETTRWKRLRGDATYVYRRAKVSAGAVAKRFWRA